MKGASNSATPATQSRGLCMVAPVNSSCYLDGRSANRDVLAGAAFLLFVLFFVFLVFVLGRCVAIFARLFLIILFLVLIVIVIFRDDIEVYGMDLRHFQLGLTLWAAQDLPLFHFVFVNIDLGRTLRAADHGSILRKMNAGWREIASTTVGQVLYTAANEVNSMQKIDANSGSSNRRLG